MKFYEFLATNILCRPIERGQLIVSPPEPPATDGYRLERLQCSDEHWNIFSREAGDLWIRWQAKAHDLPESRSAES